MQESGKFFNKSWPDWKLTSDIGKKTLPRKGSHNTEIQTELQNVYMVVQCDKNTNTLTVAFQ